MTREEFLDIASAGYDKLQAIEQNNFYDYEKSFEELWTDYGKTVMEKELSKGKKTKDRRKKKL